MRAVKGGRIHIIEGEAGWGEGLTPELETAGFTVARLPAPDSSNMRLIAPGPDMVILDENVSDSLLVCRQYATAGVPVILVGSDPSEEIWRKAVTEAGAEFYFTKPTRRKEMVARVIAILRRY